MLIHPVSKSQPETSFRKPILVVGRARPCSRAAAAHLVRAYRGATRGELARLQNTESPPLALHARVRKNRGGVRPTSHRGAHFCASPLAPALPTNRSAAARALTFSDGSNRVPDVCVRRSYFMPPSKRKTNGRTNVQNAQHVKAAAQARAASSSRSGAGTSPAGARAARLASCRAVRAIACLPVVNI